LVEPEYLNTLDLVDDARMDSADKPESAFLARAEEETLEQQS